MSPDQVERSRAAAHRFDRPESSDSERPPAASRQLEPRRARKIVAALLLMSALVAAGTMLWVYELRDRLVPKRFGVVVPGEIYRSGQVSRFLIEDVIDRNNLGAIVDLNGFEPLNADQQVEVAVAKARGLRHARFPLRGNGTGDIRRFAAAIEAIVQAQKDGLPVLVHCAAGTQRTGACVAFYRLLVRHDPPDRVRDEQVYYGWDRQANSEVISYINGHMSELAALLVKSGVIERIPEPLPTL